MIIVTGSAPGTFLDSRAIAKEIRKQMKVKEKRICPLCDGELEPRTSCTWVCKRCGNKVGTCSD